MFFFFCTLSAKNVLVNVLLVLHAHVISVLESILCLDGIKGIILELACSHQSIEHSACAVFIAFGYFCRLEKEEFYVKNCKITKV